jgi:non-homologous end joining protein Ku
LFVGSLKQEIIEGNPLEPSEHKILLRKLHGELSKDKRIYKGKVDLIAGEKIRYRPAAIYYRCGKMFENQPIIYEVETCNSVSTEDAMSRCRLFSETANNLFSKFYFVVPKDCGAKTGKELAEKMLKKNKTDLVEIMSL